MNGNEGNEGPASWLGRAMKQHPDVLELRETLRAFADGGAPAPSFGRDAAHAAHTETPEALPAAAVLELIVQYLHEQGYTQARDAVLQEAVTLCPELFDDLAVVVHPEAAISSSASSASSSSSATSGAGAGAPNGEGEGEGEGEGAGAGVRAGVPEFTEDLLDPAYQRALLPLLQLGVKDAKNLFGPLPSDGGDEADPEVEAYEEYDGEVDFQEEEADEHDVNVWDEETVEGENSLWRDGKPNSGALLAGTLNQVVRWLTEPLNTDAQFVRTFLLGHPALVPSEKLAAKLLQRYHIPAQRTGGQEVMRQLLALRVLRTWVKAFPGDIVGPVQEQLVHFVKSISDKEKSEEFKQLAALLEKPGGGATGAAGNGAAAGNATTATSSTTTTTTTSTGDFTGVEEFPQPEDLRFAPPLVTTKDVFRPNLTLEMISECETARQLCLLDFKLYWRIQPRELLGCAWLRDPARAPNVAALLQRERDLTRWATACVVSGRWAVEDAECDRAKIYHRLCAVAHHLLDYGDYTGAFALAAALSSSTVARIAAAADDTQARGLAGTMRRGGLGSSVGGLGSSSSGSGGGSGAGALTSAQILERLTAHFSPDGNYAAYRAALAAPRAPVRAADPAAELLPCGTVPLLSVHLNDLAMTQDAMPDLVGNGLLNVQKIAHQVRQIEAFLAHQKAVYPFLPIAQIMTLLRGWALPSDKALLEGAAAAPTSPAAIAAAPSH